jgi:hypothetical protein
MDLLFFLFQQIMQSLVISGGQIKTHPGIIKQGAPGLVRTTGFLAQNPLQRPAQQLAMRHTFCHDYRPP